MFENFIRKSLEQILKNDLGIFLAAFLVNSSIFLINSWKQSLRNFFKNSWKNSLINSCRWEFSKFCRNSSKKSCRNSRWYSCFVKIVNLVKNSGGIYWKNPGDISWDIPGRVPGDFPAEILGEYPKKNPTGIRSAFPLRIFWVTPAEILK